MSTGGREAAMREKFERAKLLIDEIHECADDPNLSVEDFAYVAQDNVHDLKEVYDQLFEEVCKSLCWNSAMEGPAK
jgi:hypothetical protein